MQLTHTISRRRDEADRRTATDLGLPLATCTRLWGIVGDRRRQDKLKTSLVGRTVSRLLTSYITFEMGLTTQRVGVGTGLSGGGGSADIKSRYACKH